MKPLYILACLCGALSLSPLAANADEAQAMPSRQTLLTKEVTLTATQMVTNVIRVEFPPGVKTPTHTHEGQGPRYIIKGHFKVEVSGNAQVFGPGDVFWD
jgi:quercetin dioxygenase-like cupin family protein